MAGSTGLTEGSMLMSPLVFTTDQTLLPAEVSAHPPRAVGVQTVCKSNKQEDWCTIHSGDEDGGEGGEIIGIPQEKLNVRNDQ